MGDGHPMNADATLRCCGEADCYCHAGDDVCIDCGVGLIEARRDKAQAIAEELHELRCRVKGSTKTIAKAQSQRDKARNEADRLRAALDRVRALCDDPRIAPGEGWSYLVPAEVRTALDGPQEVDDASR